MIEFGDIFTCNTARSLFFAQDLWGPYPTVLAEGKPPPEPPPDSTGAAYSARNTLTIMSEMFDERFGQANRGIEDQQHLWTGPSDKFLSEIGEYFTLLWMGWSSGLNSIHPGSTFEAPIGLIKKTSTNKATRKSVTYK